MTSVCAAQSLRQDAENDGLLIGAAVRPSLFSETAYASTLAREFSMVEPEDAMKWRALRPDAKTYDFRQGDEGRSLCSDPSDEDPRPLSSLGPR